MKSTFCLLQNKIKNLATPTPKRLPFNECSKSIVQASTDPSKPALTIGTQLPKLPWHEMEYVTNRRIHENDVIQLRYLINLIKDIQECQNEQYDFFQKYSKYLELDRTVFPNILCLCAPMDVIKEQQDLLERERNLKREFTKKKAVKKSISFWARFRKPSRLQSEIDAEYASLQRIFIHLANDNNTELRVIAFLSVVFSCQTGLVDEITGKKSKEMESHN